MRWIFLSPHLDDAVFSAGGMIRDITRGGIQVEIWTVMCGDPQLREYSPFAMELHEKWGFASAEETVQRRREEDKSAAIHVGATTQHFDFLDCIYRRGENGDWLYSAITLPPHEADAQYPIRIAAEVSARLAPDDMLVCQLALGSHVDHVLVRRAAELLGRPLRYIVDVPYWFYSPEEFETKSAGLKESAYKITEPNLDMWIEAALSYRSQFPVLGDRFDTPEKAKESIRQYWSEREGIRLLQIE